MKVVTFKLEESLLKELDILAFKRNTTRSEIIRRAIRCYIRSEATIKTRRLTIY